MSYDLKKKEKEKTSSWFPQTRKVKSSHISYCLCVFSVFSACKGGRRMVGAGLLVCSEAIPPSCGNSLIGPKP